MSNKAADFDEARWRRLTDARAAGESIDRADEVFVESFVPRSPAARAEAELFAALEGLGGDDDDEEAANSPLVDATVEHVFAASAAAVVGSPEPAAASAGAGSRGRILGAVLGLAAVAAAVALWVGPGASSSGDVAEPSPAMAHADTSPPSDPPMPSEVTPPSEASSPEAPAPVAPVEPRFAMASGDWFDAAGQRWSDAHWTEGAAELRAGDGSNTPGCLEYDQHSVCFEGAGEVELLPSSDGSDGSDGEPTLLVLHGDAVITAAPEATSIMRVEIAGARYEVQAPVTIESHVVSRKVARVEVTAGQVEWVDAQGRRHTQTAGQVRGRTTPAVKVPVPDAKMLLSKARGSRAGGDPAAAIAHYEQLVRHYPEAAASRTAMVTLGQLYLGQGKPKAALRWYQRYLKKGGDVAEEAHVGRIRALGALGRDQQRAEAIEQFRRKYPSSRYGEKFGD